MVNDEFYRRRKNDEKKKIVYLRLQNFWSCAEKWLEKNKIISGEPCNGSNLVEKIISKDSRAVRPAFGE